MLSYSPNFCLFPTFFKAYSFAGNRIIMNSYNLIFVKICFNDPSNVRFECNSCTLVRHIHEVYTVSVLIFPKLFATFLFFSNFIQIYILLTIMLIKTTK